jgi:hypothetical protein
MKHLQKPHENRVAPDITNINKKGRGGGYPLTGVGMRRH